MNNTSPSSEISSSNTCANCGKEGSDVTNSCNKCKSVMYCNAACKKKHRSKHKKQCERLVAELHDEKLFKQPPPDEDCPICMIRLPFLGSGIMYMECCGKMLCSGCILTPVRDHEGNVIAEKTCPFCRTPLSDSDEECLRRLEKRMDLNDPIAIYNMGNYYRYGMYGLLLDYAKALELWHRAAELGNAEAYYGIGDAYYSGKGVEFNMEKARHYWELGAIRGDVKARYNLGCDEGNLGNYDRALRHWMIAARNGYTKSLKKIQEMYGYGYATKEDYAKALRAYQAYLDEIRSDQRDKAAAFSDEYKYYDSSF